MGVYTTIDPGSGEQLAQYPEISDAGLDDLIGRSTTAYRSWRTISLDQRRAVLTRAAEIHREQADELAKLLTLEMGKPIAQAKGEVELVASIYQYYADHVAEFLADEPLTIAGPGTAVVRTEPIGPLVGVMPWNYPYYQVARFAAPNIALGNTIVLKHARNCPQSALAVERVLAEAGLPDGVYLNAFISSAQVAAAIADPRVQGVSVTGSEKAGSAVGEVAGRHMKKVVLELGGSDPFVVLADADVDAAAAAAVVGRFANGGQACTASKRFIVDERVYDEFVAKLIDGIACWQPGDPTSPETKLGPLASNTGAEELDELVQDAVSNGAEVLVGGDSPTGAYYPPTVLARVTRGMRAYREELFGPVAVVYRVGSLDEAVELANDSPFGLASSVFTTDLEEGQPGGRGPRDRHGVDQQHQQDGAGPPVRGCQGLGCRPRAGPVRIRRIRQQETREKPERTTEMKMTADTQDTRDRSTAMVDDRYQRGLDRMMELVSTEHTNTFDHAKLVESYKALDPDLPDYIVSFAFGDIYSRTSLTQQEQTLVTISTLVALGTEPQLKLHINTGFNVGLTKEKIVGALIHCIPYVGFPRVLNGLTLLKQVMAERGLTSEANAD